MNNLEGIAQNTNPVSELGIIMDTSVEAPVGNYRPTTGFDMASKYGSIGKPMKDRKPIMSSSVFFLYCIGQ